MGAAVELVELSKRYGPLAAVSQLSLRTEPGEFVTLLGPSGSGKTTTLSAIAGFVTPSIGRILIDGKRVEHLPPEARNIGVVFQHYALFPHMTVAENVAFPLEMRSVPRARVNEMVRATLDSVRLSGFGYRFPSELSGGQQQRVALARALVFNPPVLLLDEPLSALDKKLRESMQLELKRLHLRTNVTMIYVTHDQEEALFLSDRVVVMNRGRIEQIGKPEEIYASPRTRFVAEFIGESNFLNAEILKREDGRTLLRTAGGLNCVANGSSSGEVGARVNMMIRPEQIVLGPQAAGLANQFCARIDEKFFVGGTVKYKLRLSPADSITVTLKNSRGHALSEVIGSEVVVGWAPEDVLTYVEPNR